MDQRHKRKQNIPKSILPPIVIENSIDSSNCFDILREGDNDNALDMNDENAMDMNDENTMDMNDENAMDVDDAFHLRSGRVLNGNDQDSILLRNTVFLDHTLQIADRLKMSDAKVAAIGNAILTDYKVVDERNKRLLLGRGKIRRGRTKAREKMLRLHKQNRTPMIGLYFDGRKDWTKVYENKRIITKKEEHISLVQMPGSVYVGHVTIGADKSDSFGTSETMLDYLEKNSISTDEWLFAGADGCPPNTGWKGGTLFYIERKLQRSLQWIICLLHMNELPLRNLIKKHDGGTTGPSTFSGSIGQSLDDCEKLPIIAFEPIEFKCTVKNLDAISSSLSTDQQYLFKICNVISAGKCDKDFAIVSPGKSNHSRWLTTANRLCRLYISTPKSKFLLISLVKYVLWVYAPTHFHIKYESSCVFGAIHLTNIIKASRFLAPKYLKTVRDTIQTNAFFAHHENVLLAILNDDDQRIRLRGWKKILKIRKNQSENDQIRQFRVPLLNFNANHYSQISDWENHANSVPPILRNFNFDANDATIFARKKLNEHELGFDIMQVPSHTQAVERCVKIVTEASDAVCGEEKRDGFIINKLKSQKHMPKFTNKSDFNVNPCSIEQILV